MNLGLSRGLSDALVEYEEERVSLILDEPVRHSRGFVHMLKKNQILPIPLFLVATKMQHL